MANTIQTTVPTLRLTPITATRTGAKVSNVLLPNGQQFAYTTPDPLRTPYDVSGFGGDETKQSFCIQLDESCQDFWRILSDALRDHAAKTLDLDPRDYHDIVRDSNYGPLVKCKIARGHSPTQWWDADKNLLPHPPDSIAGTRCRVRIIIGSVWIQPRSWGFVLTASHIEHHPDADIEECPFV